MSSDVSSCVAVHIYINKPFKVMVSAVTLMAFFVNIFAYDLASAAEVSRNVIASPASTVIASPEGAKQSMLNFHLPEYLGYIKDSYFTPHSQLPTPNSRLVIHIQDAHCNYAAQNSIANIIDYLNRNYGINTINLEGGEENYNLSPFYDIKDTDLRAKTADYFLKEGEINAAEFYSINNPSKLTLWGVEDTSLYVKNLKVYRDSLKNKENIDRSLNALSGALSNLKAKIYSKELLVLDRKTNDLNNKAIDLKEYIAYITSLSKDLKVPISDLKNLDILNKALFLEKGVDFKKSNVERDQLIDELNKAFSRNERDELVQKAIEFKLGRLQSAEFYSYLRDKANDVGLDLMPYKDLTLYMDYIKLYSAAKKEEVFKEVEVLENRIKDKLYKNEAQRKLAILLKHISLIKNILNITLTKEEFQYYQEHKKEFRVDNFTGFIEEKNGTVPIFSDVRKLDGYLEDMEQFYLLSFKRDDEFIKRLKFSQYKHGVSMLITGGFHSENLAALFKKKGISYISIMPNFGLDDKECPYFRLLAGKSSIFQKYLNASVSALAHYAPFSDHAPTVYGPEISNARAGCVRDVAAGKTPTEALKTQPAPSAGPAGDEVGGVSRSDMPPKAPGFAGDGRQKSEIMKFVLGGIASAISLFTYVIALKELLQICIDRASISASSDLALPLSFLDHSAWGAFAALMLALTIPATLSFINKIMNRAKANRTQNFVKDTWLFPPIHMLGFFLGNLLVYYRLQGFCLFNGEKSALANILQDSLVNAGDVLIWVTLFNSLLFFGSNTCYQIKHHITDGSSMESFGYASYNFYRNAWKITVAFVLLHIAREVMQLFPYLRMDSIGPCDPWDIVFYTIGGLISISSIYLVRKIAFAIDRMVGGEAGRGKGIPKRSLSKTLPAYSGSDTGAIGVDFSYDYPNTKGRNPPDGPHGGEVGKASPSGTPLKAPGFEEREDQITAKISEINELLDRENSQGPTQLSRAATLNDLSSVDRTIYEGGVGFVPKQEGQLIVASDLHGNLKALSSILEETRFVERLQQGENVKILFLGDYTHFGIETGVETILALINLKLAYPDNVFIVRGNNEIDMKTLDEEDKRTAIEDPFGGPYRQFYKELHAKFPDNADRLFDEFIGLFDRLPALMLFGNGLVASHGGPVSMKGEGLEYPAVKDVVSNPELQRQFTTNWIYHDEATRQKLLTTFGAENGRRNDDTGVDTTGFGKWRFNVVPMSMGVEYLRQLGAKHWARGHNHESVDMLPVVLGEENKIITLLAGVPQDTQQRYGVFDLNDADNYEVCTFDTTGRESQGGSWSGHPTYMRWVAPWLETFVALGASWLFLAHYNNGLAAIAVSALTTGSVFWLPHSFRGKEVLFSKNVLGLSVGTAIGGALLSLHPHLFLPIFGIIAGVHFVINWETHEIQYSTIESLLTFDTSSLVQDRTKPEYEESARKVEEYLMSLEKILKNEGAGKVDFDMWVGIMRQYTLNMDFIVKTTLPINKRNSKILKINDRLMKKLYKLIQSQPKSGLLREQYFEKLLRWHIELHSSYNAKKERNLGSFFTQDLINKIVNDNFAVDHELIEAMAVKFKAKERDKNFTRPNGKATSVASDDNDVLLKNEAMVAELREYHPAIYNLLFYEQNIVDLTRYLSFLRHFVEYWKFSDGITPPYEFARKHNISFELGGGLCVTPVTESFRRFIIFEKESGFKIEIKIPGLLTEKQHVSYANYVVANDIWQAYKGDESILEEPIAMLELGGPLEMYGATLPMRWSNVMVFTYRNDANRQLSVGLYKLNKRYREGLSRGTLAALLFKVYGWAMPKRRQLEELKEVEHLIAEQRVTMLAKVHALGYGGGDDVGSGNNRLTLANGKIRLFLAGDLEGYRKVGDERVFLQELEQEVLSNFRSDDPYRNILTQLYREARNRFSTVASSAIGRSFPREEEAAGESKRDWTVLKEHREANFWLGGRDSPIYRSLNPKEELAIEENQDVGIVLSALKALEGKFKKDDIILLYLHSSYRVRLVAATLGEFLEEKNAGLIMAAFAADRLSALDMQCPFIFEQTIDIDSEHQDIRMEGLYLDPSRRGRGYVQKLFESQREIFEQNFQGYKVKAKAAHIMPMRFFAKFYQGDLDYAENGRSILTLEGELYFLLRLGLVTEAEAFAIGQNAGVIEHYVPRKLLLYEILRKKWAILGNGNTLKAIITRLEQLRVSDGQDEIDKLLFTYGGFDVEGIIGKTRPYTGIRESLFIDEKQLLIDCLTKQIREAIADSIIKNRPLSSPLDVVISNGDISPELKIAAEELKGLASAGEKIDFEKFFLRHHSLSIAENKFLASLVMPKGNVAGGSWFGHPTYVRWIAPWFEPLLALGVSSLLFVYGYHGLAIIVASALTTGSVFWLPHSFRGKEVLFSKNVLGLSVGTAIGGALLSLHPHLFLPIFGIIAGVHFWVNWRIAPMGIATSMVGKEIKPNLGVFRFRGGMLSRIYPNNSQYNYKNQHPSQKYVYSHFYSLFSMVAIMYAATHNINPNINTLNLNKDSDWLMTMAANTILPNSYNAIASPFLWLSLSLIIVLYVAYKGGKVNGIPLEENRDGPKGAAPQGLTKPDISPEAPAGPTAGAWFANENYIRSWAWWLEPAVSVIGTTVGMAFVDLPYLTPFIGAAIFWGFHLPFNRKAIFTKEVLLLTVGTFVVLLPVTIFFTPLLVLAHYCINLRDNLPEISPDGSLPASSQETSERASPRPGILKRITGIITYLLSIPEIMRAEAEWSVFFAALQGERTYNRDNRIEQEKEQIALEKEGSNSRHEQSEFVRPRYIKRLRQVSEHEQSEFVRPRYIKRLRQVSDTTLRELGYRILSLEHMLEYNWENLQGADDEKQRARNRFPLVLANIEELETAWKEVCALDDTAALHLPTCLRLARQNGKLPAPLFSDDARAYLKEWCRAAFKYVDPAIAEAGRRSITHVFDLAFDTLEIAENDPSGAIGGAKKTSVKTAVLLGGNENALREAIAASTFIGLDNSGWETYVYGDERFVIKVPKKRFSAPLTLVEQKAVHNNVLMARLLYLVHKYLPSSMAHPIIFYGRLIWRIVHGRISQPRNENIDNELSYRVGMRINPDIVVPFRILHDLKVRVKGRFGIKTMTLPRTIVQERIRTRFIDEIKELAAAGKIEEAKRRIDEALAIYPRLWGQGVFLADMNIFGNMAIRNGCVALMDIGNLAESEKEWFFSEMGYVTNILAARYSRQLPPVLLDYFKSQARNIITQQAFSANWAADNTHDDGAIGKGSSFDSRNEVKTKPLTDTQKALVRTKIDELKAKVKAAQFTEDEAGRVSQALERLEQFFARSDAIVSFDSIVRGKEDYLLAFADPSKIALMNDMFEQNLIDYLDEILFHEAYTSLFGEGSYEEHRKLVNGIQRKIFGEENPLRDALRAYITRELILNAFHNDSISIERTIARNRYDARAIDASVAEFERKVRDTLDEVWETHPDKTAIIAAMDTANEHRFMPYGYFMLTSPFYFEDERAFVLYRVEYIDIVKAGADEIMAIYVRRVTPRSDKYRDDMGSSSIINDYVVVFKDSTEDAHRIVEGITYGKVPDARKAKRSFGIIQLLHKKAFSRMNPTHRLRLIEKSTLRHEIEHEMRRRMLAEIGKMTEVKLSLEEQLACLRQLMDAEEPWHELGNLIWNSREDGWAVVSRLAGGREKIKVWVDRMLRHGSAKELRRLARKAYIEVESEWSEHYGIAFPESLANIKVKVVRRIYLFKEKIAPRLQSPASLQSDSSAISIGARAQEKAAEFLLSMLQGSDSAWAGFMDMAKTRLRNDLYTEQVIDIVIPAVRDIVRETLETKYGGIIFTRGGDEIRFVLPGDLNAEDVRRALIEVQKALYEKFDSREYRERLAETMRSAGINEESIMQFVEKFHIPFEPSGCVKVKNIKEMVSREKGRTPIEKALVVLDKYLKYAEMAQGKAKEEYRLVEVVEDFKTSQKTGPPSILSTQEKRDIETARKSMEGLPYELEKEYPSIMRRHLWEVVNNAAAQDKPAVYLIRGPPDSFYIVRICGPDGVQVIKISAEYKAPDDETEKARTERVFDEMRERSRRTQSKRESDAIKYYGFKEPQEAFKSHGLGNDWIKLGNLGIYDAFKPSEEFLTDAEILKSLSDAAQRLNSHTARPDPADPDKLLFEVVFDASEANSNSVSIEGRESVAHALMPVVEQLEEARNSAIRIGIGRGEPTETRDGTIGKESPELKSYAHNSSEETWKAILAENKKAREMRAMRAGPELDAEDRRLRKDYDALLASLQTPGMTQNKTMFADVYNNRSSFILRSGQPVIDDVSGTFVIKYPKANALVQASNIKENDVILNPFSGTGGVLFLAAANPVSPRKIIGVDIAYESPYQGLQYLPEKNFEAWKEEVSKLPIDIRLTRISDIMFQRDDARTLDRISTGSVTKIISNPPYGRGMEIYFEINEEEAFKLFLESLSAAHRVLTDAGEAYYLVPNEWIDEIERRDMVSGYGFNMAVIQRNVEGITSAIIKLTKKPFSSVLPPGEGGRGYSGLPNNEYSPVIEEAIASGNFSAAGYSKSSGFSNVPLTLDSGAPKMGLALTEGRLKKLEEARKYISEYDLKIIKENGIIILFIEGLDKHIAERIAVQDLSPPNNCYGSHYGLSRPQCYLDTARLDNPRELAGHLHHEIQERQEVRSGLNMEEVPPIEKRGLELNAKIQQLASAAHNRLKDEDLAEDARESRTMVETASAPAQFSEEQIKGAVRDALGPLVKDRAVNALARAIMELQQQEPFADQNSMRYRLTSIKGIGPSSAASISAALFAMQDQKKVSGDLTREMPPGVVTYIPFAHLNEKDFIRHLVDIKEAQQAAKRFGKKLIVLMGFIGPPLPPDVLRNALTELDPSRPHPVTMPRLKSYFEREKALILQMYRDVGRGKIFDFKTAGPFQRAVMSWSATSRTEIVLENTTFEDWLAFYWGEANYNAAQALFCNTGLTATHDQETYIRYMETFATTWADTLRHRNTNIVAQVEETARSGQPVAVFYGASHLGVVDALRARGLQVAQADSGIDIGTRLQFTSSTELLAQRLSYGEKFTTEDRELVYFRDPVRLSLILLAKKRGNQDSAEVYDFAERVANRWTKPEILEYAKAVQQQVKNPSIAVGDWFLQNWIRDNGTAEEKEFFKVASSMPPGNGGVNPVVLVEIDLTKPGALTLEPSHFEALIFGILGSEMSQSADQERINTIIKAILARLDPEQQKTLLETAENWQPLLGSAEKNAKVQAALQAVRAEQEKRAKKLIEERGAVRLLISAQMILIKALNDYHTLFGYIEAVKLIGAMFAYNPQAAEILLEKALNNPFGSVRREAAKSIGAMFPHNPQRAERLLRKALKDNSYESSEWSVDGEAAKSIGAMFPYNFRGAERLLREALHVYDGNIIVQEEAARSIGAMFPHNPQRAERLLREALTFSDVHVRRGAAYSIGAMFIHNPAEAEALLKETLKDPDNFVREKAVQSIGAVFAYNATEAETLLREELEDPVWNVRRGAAKLIGAMFAYNSQVAEILLEKALNDLSAHVRQEATHSIGAMFAYNSQVAEILLRKTLEDPVPDVRQGAAESIGAMFAYNATEAETLLRKALRDLVPDVRQGAAESIGAMFAHNPQGAEILLRETLEDPVRDVRQGAAESIGAIFAHNPQGAEILLQKALKGSDKFIQKGAIKSIGSMFEIFSRKEVEAINQYTKVSYPVLAEIEDESIALGLYYAAELSGKDITGSDIENYRSFISGIPESVLTEEDKDYYKIPLAVLSYIHRDISSLNQSILSDKSILTKILSFITSIITNDYDSAIEAINNVKVSTRAMMSLYMSIYIALSGKNIGKDDLNKLKGLLAGANVTGNLEREKQFFIFFINAFSHGRISKDLYATVFNSADISRDKEMKKFIRYVTVLNVFPDQYRKEYTPDIKDQRTDLVKERAKLIAILTGKLAELLSLNAQEEKALNESLDKFTGYWQDTKLYEYVLIQAAFFTPKGKEALKRLVLGIAKEIKLPDEMHYETIIEGGFKDEFIARWKKEYAKYLQDIKPEELKIDLFSIYEQIISHLGMTPEALAALPSEYRQIEGISEAAISLKAILDALRKNETPDESLVTGVLSFIAQGGAKDIFNKELITDLRNLLPQEIPPEVFKSVPRIRITQDPAIFMRAGIEPSFTCQRCTSKSGYNEDGQFINRILNGQFKVCQYLLGNTVVARTLLETALDDDGNPVLLVEGIYGHSALPFDRNQFEREIVTYAASLGIKRVFWADEPIGVSSEKADIPTLLPVDGALYRDNFKVAGSSYPATDMLPKAVPPGVGGIDEEEIKVASQGEGGKEKIDEPPQVTGAEGITKPTVGSTADRGAAVVGSYSKVSEVATDSSTEDRQTSLLKALKGILKDVRAPAEKRILFIPQKGDRTDHDRIRAGILYSLGKDGFSGVKVEFYDGTEEGLEKVAAKHSTELSEPGTFALAYVDSNRIGEDSLKTHNTDNPKFKWIRENLPDGVKAEELFMHVAFALPVLDYVKNNSDPDHRRKIIDIIEKMVDNNQKDIDLLKADPDHIFKSGFILLLKKITRIDINKELRQRAHSLEDILSAA